MSLTLEQIAGHFGQAAWTKLQLGEYPGNQSEQRDALKADLGVRSPEDDAEWNWIENSYIDAVDKWHWIAMLGRLSAYNEGTDQDNAAAKSWMRAAELGP